VSPGLIALLAGPVLLLPLAFYSLARPHVRGTRWYGLLLLTIAFWSVSYAWELSAHDLGTKALALKVKYLAVVTLPSGWIGFILAFVGFPPSRVWPRVAPVALVSGVMLIAAWTDGWHGLFWGPLTVQEIGSYRVVQGRGPLFWANVAYTYGVLGTGVFLLALHAAQSPFLYKKRALTLMIGTIVPWAGNLVFVINREESILDPTPFLFTCTAVIAAVAVFRYRLFEAVPTLRDARIEAVGDGVILVDVRRRIADLNPAAEGMLGCTRAEAAGTRLERFLPQLSAEALPDSRMDVTIGSGPVARTYDLRAAATRSRAGETTGAVVVLRDVTERRLAERALRASEHRYRTVIEQAFDGVWLADANGTIVDANPGASTMLGYTRAELIGRRVADLLVRDGGEEVTAGQSPAADPAYWQRRIAAKDGRSLLLAGRTSQVAADLAVSTFRDITEERAHAEQRERLLNEAQVANRLKDEFLATLSHELRTPLTVVLGWARMLVRAEVEPDRVSHALSVIERNAMAQARLVDDLLDLSLMTRGQLRLKISEIDVTSLVNDALEAIAPSAQAKGVSLRVQLPPLPPIRVDAERLRQVIWNLLTNAIKFTPPGGTVTVSSAATADGVLVAVQDTGQGIAPDFLPFVFDPFLQGESGTTRAVAGLGLGLTIVRRIVEAHGGRVEAASEGLGHGATFRLHLPAAVARLTAHSGSEGPPTTSDRDRHV
jgi:PAS domain S-box-containing protein